MLYEILKPFAIFLFKIFFKIEVKGKEKIPKKGRFILASNHMSVLDPVVLGVACPRRLYFLAKEELFENKLFSLLIKTLGAIPLKRENSDLRAIRKALSLLAEGKPVVIFPQGTRGRFSEVKKGVGFLAKKSNSCVVISKIVGTEKILPKGRKRLRLGKIKVIFDKVHCEADDYQNFSLKIFERIINLD